MPDDTFQILSLFCGAGGLDWGFRQERFRVVLALDNLPAAVNTYNLNAKRRAARIADLSRTTPGEIVSMLEERSPGVQLAGVVGGPPCQGFSRGNQRPEADDPRNLLPFKYANILSGLRVRYALHFFIFENVMGLTNPRHKERFSAIKRAFTKAGFRIFYKELNASSFGVAQHRPRLFIVGLNASLYPEQEFAFPTGRAARVSVRAVIGGLPKPAFFMRGMDRASIPHHPNHWTMMPKSQKLLRSLPTTDGRSFRQLSWDDVSRTVAYGNREIHVHPDGGRRLSVHEAMLLQGFPSTYCLTGNFSEQITQVSNAVPPPVSRALAHSVRLFLLAERARGRKAARSSPQTAQAQACLSAAQM
jgi:DNA (cytosine-5)-methyltransferase 1